MINQSQGINVSLIVQSCYNYSIQKLEVNMLSNTEHYKIIQGNCLELLNDFEPESINMIFADPPYRVSNDGITCKSGKIASVNKGTWDRSMGLIEDHQFNKEWLTACDRVLDGNGTIWVSGTYHIIHSIVFALMEMDYHILNEIIWLKPNAPPNMGCRCFTASHETLVWAKKDKKAKHTFNYKDMKLYNNNLQMRSVWEIPTTPKREKLHGQHPTQKPYELLKRCILASTVQGDLVLDPFCGSGTTGLAALEHGRRFIGIELDSNYCNITEQRLKFRKIYNMEEEK